MQAVVRLCATQVPFVARGHGTGLSGGALPRPDGVLIVLSRLNRILDIDIPNLRVTVEPGVTNLEITRQVAPFGCYYAPDPSSQIVCSIGGNIAENSGGAHCLKYGFTVHHVLGVEAVLPDGELVQLGGGALDAPGLDLLGVLVGSEGTLAVVTKATLRLLRRPEAVLTLLAGFDSIDAAGEAVSAIIACGIVPAAVEMMDRLTIDAAEAAVHPEFPDDQRRADRRARRPATRKWTSCSRSSKRSAGERGAGNGGDRARRRRARADLEGAQGGVRGDGTRLAELLRAGRRRARGRGCPRCSRRIRELEARSGLRIGNVFHAGDGNLHPLICYDESIPGQAEHAEEVAVGDPATTASRPAARSPASTASAPTRRRTCRRCSRPTISTRCSCCAAPSIPSGICNPGKVFPTPRLCGEVPGPYRQHPLERAGLAERF